LWYFIPPQFLLELHEDASSATTSNNKKILMIFSFIDGALFKKNAKIVFLFNKHGLILIF